MGFLIAMRPGTCARDSLIVIGLIVTSLAASAQEKPRSITSPVNPFEQLSEKTILVVTPHPDDDITGCGGALAFLSGRGNRLVVVFLTAGEKGTFDPSVQAETIKQTRMQEAAAAYKTIGFPNAELAWFGYPDGELDFAPLREIRMRLTQIIRRHRPDVVFALDPGATYYRYHYRDHRTAALVSADAIGAAMWPLEYPELGPPHRVPEVYYFYAAEPTLRLDITSVYQKKLSALAQHRSQFPPAVNHFTPIGPAPTQNDLEAMIKPWTGSTTIESFRRR